MANQLRRTMKRLFHYDRVTGGLNKGPHAFVLLDLRKARGNTTGAMGYAPQVRGDVSRVTGLWHPLVSGDVSNIRGDITKLVGDLSRLRGDVSGIWGYVGSPPKVSALLPDQTGNPAVDALITAGRSLLQKIKEDSKALTGDVSAISGNVTFIHGDASNISGEVSRLRGDVSRLTGNVSGLAGDVSALTGNVTGLKGDATRISGDASNIRGSLRNEVPSLEGLMPLGQILLDTYADSVLALASNEDARELLLAVADELYNVWESAAIVLQETHSLAAEVDARISPEGAAAAASAQLVQLGGGHRDDAYRLAGESGAVLAPRPGLEARAQEIRAATLAARVTLDALTLAFQAVDQGGPATPFPGLEARDPRSWGLGARLSALAAAVQALRPLPQAESLGGALSSMVLRMERRERLLWGVPLALDPGGAPAAGSAPALLAHAREKAMEAAEIARALEQASEDWRISGSERARAAALSFWDAEDSDGQVRVAMEAAAAAALSCENGSAAPPSSPEWSGPSVWHWAEAESYPAMGRPSLGGRHGEVASSAQAASLAFFALSDALEACKAPLSAPVGWLPAGGPYTGYSDPGWPEACSAAAREAADKAEQALLALAELEVLFWECAGGSAASAAEVDSADDLVEQLREAATQAFRMLRDCRDGAESSSPDPEGGRLFWESPAYAPWFTPLKELLAILGYFKDAPEVPADYLYEAGVYGTWASDVPLLWPGIEPAEQASLRASLPAPDSDALPWWAVRSHALRAGILAARVEGPWLPRASDLVQAAWAQWETLSGPARRAADLRAAQGASARLTAQWESTSAEVLRRASSLRSGAIAPDASYIKLLNGSNRLKKLIDDDGYSMNPPVPPETVGTPSRRSLRALAIEWSDLAAPVPAGEGLVFRMDAAAAEASADIAAPGPALSYQTLLLLGTQPADLFPSGLTSARMLDKATWNLMRAGALAAALARYTPAPPPGSPLPAEAWDQPGGPAHAGTALAEAFMFLGAALDDGIYPAADPWAAYRPAGEPPVPLPTARDALPTAGDPQSAWRPGLLFETSEVSALAEAISVETAQLGGPASALRRAALAAVLVAQAAATALAEFTTLQNTLEVAEQASDVEEAAGNLLKGVRYSAWVDLATSFVSAAVLLKERMALFLRGGSSLEEPLERIKQLGKVGALGAPGILVSREDHEALLSQVKSLRTAYNELQASMDGIGREIVLRADLLGLFSQVGERIQGDVSSLSGDISGLWGDVSGLSGDATALVGDATGVQGDLSLGAPSKLRSYGTFPGQKAIGENRTETVNNELLDYWVYPAVKSVI